MKKFFLINVHAKRTLEDLQANRQEFFKAVTSTMAGMFHLTVNDQGQIRLKLERDPVSFSSLEQAQAEMAKNDADHMWLVEYDDKTQLVSAIRENYFTPATRIDVSHLFLKNDGKYSHSPIDPQRLNDSVSYGLLKEFAGANAGQKDTYKRGLRLIDLLLTNPPKETYQVVSKTVPSIQKRIAEGLPRPSIPQIDFDNFTAEEIREALRKYGSFELVGHTVDQLRAAANSALGKAKELLATPEDQRKPFKQEKFNGFQEVLEESKVRAKAGTGVVRNQIAFHFKPYFGRARAPESFDDGAFREYYDQGLAILQTFYRKIMLKLKADPTRLSPYENDVKSVLTSRRYFASGGEEGARTGIPAHSDYGDLTLVVSDQDGLEVQMKDGGWATAPAGNQLRFYVNPGDWFRFQIYDPTFMPGIHRVPEIPKGKPDRHSLALFYNPAEHEKLQVAPELMDLYLNFDHKPGMLAQFQKEKLPMKELSYVEYLEGYRGNDFSPIKMKAK